MADKLLFTYIDYDTGTIPRCMPPRYSMEFFKDVNENANSITNKHEKQIITWLFQNALFKRMFYGELKIKETSIVNVEVKEPVISSPNKKPGDIDILLCDINKPNEAIALEAKRIKTIVKKNGNDKINKIEDIKSGIFQANGLREMGFYNSYLALFIETDGRERQDVQFLFRSANKQTLKRLYDFPQRDKLHRDIGIVFIEVVQPIDREINRAGAIGICVVKEAKPLSQPTSLTNRITEFLKII